MKPLLPLTFVIRSGGNSPRQWVPHNLFGKRNTSQNETYRSNISHLSIILTPIWPINEFIMNDKCCRPCATRMRTYCLANVLLMVVDQHWRYCLACSRITNVHGTWTRRISEQHLPLTSSGGNLFGICQSTLSPGRQVINSLTKF